MARQLDYEKKQTTVYPRKSIKKATQMGMLDRDEDTNFSNKVQEIALHEFLNRDESIEEFTKEE